MSVPRTFLFQEPQYSPSGPLARSGKSEATKPGSRQRHRQSVAAGIAATDRWWLAGLFCLVIFGALVNFQTFRDYVFEDSYITYSYAQSLAAGDGLVFNQGERVLGTTTPFFALLLGLLGMLGCNIPAASGALFAASLGGIGLIGALLLGRFGAWRAGLFFALLTAWGSGNWLWLWGMETPFFTAILLSALWLLLEERPLGAGICLGIAFVTRYDAALFVISLLLLESVRKRRLPLRCACAAACVALPWLAFAQLYYGSVLPNTLGAKMASTTMPEYLWGSLVKQVRNFLSPLHRLVSERQLGPEIHQLTGGLLLLPILVASRALLRRELLIAQLLLFPLMSWVGYAIIGPGTGHSWHLLPAMCCAVLLSLLAWSQLLARLRFRPWMDGCLSLALAAALLGLPLAAANQNQQLVDNGFYRGRIGAYTDIARWINEKGLNDLKILMQEPGYLHFLTGNPIVDAVGLITPNVVVHDGERRRVEVNELVEKHRPDLIVTPTRYWAGLDLNGFLPLFHAVPLRTVYISKAAYKKRFDALADRWLTPPASTPPELDRANSLRVDFTAGDSNDFITTGRLGGNFITNGVGARAVAGLEPPFLSTQGDRWGGIVTPSFTIDFDEISFQFAATSSSVTIARLLIDRQEVYRATGGRRSPPPVQEVRWPVSQWRGKEAVVQFQDLARGGKFLAADRLRSCRHQRVELLADFEDPDYGDLWQTTFGDQPQALRGLAIERGVPFLHGRSAAMSMGLEGPRRMTSRPFKTDRTQLSFAALDFAGRESQIVLWAEDKIVRRWRGRNTRRSQPVVWELSRWIGKSLVLDIIDPTEEPGQWIGIDELRLFDSGC